MTSIDQLHQNNDVEDSRLYQLEPSITLIQKNISLKENVYYNKSMTYINTKPYDKALFLLVTSTKSLSLIFKYVPYILS